MTPVQKPNKKCEVCSKEVVHITRHMRTHTQTRPFKCKICPARFNHSANLTVHTRIHTGKKPFKCQHCGNSFTFRPTLRQHLKSVHLKCREFYCIFCYKLFSTKQDELRHYMHHLGEKPFPCELCGASFTKSSDRNTHVTHHTGEKTFHCKHCSKSFAAKRKMHLHEKIHASDRLRLFECSVCNAKFMDENSLKSHTKRMHIVRKSYGCEKCAQRFKNVSALRRHDKLKHKPFELEHWCVFCLRGFYAKHALFIHLRGHTKEMPYSCEQCDARFSHLSYRIQHVKKHHRA